MNSYAVWQWEGQDIRRRIIPGEDYPTDPGPTVAGQFDGRPKYSVLSWCWRKLSGGKYPEPPRADFIASNSPDGDMLNPDSLVMRLHRTWTARDARRSMPRAFPM